MDNAPRVAITQAQQDLPEELATFLLRQLCSHNDIVKEFPYSGKKDDSARGGKVVKRNDIHTT